MYKNMENSNYRRWLTWCSPLDEIIYRSARKIQNRKMEGEWKNRSIQNIREKW
jgi:hypothetical protein